MKSLELKLLEKINDLKCAKTKHISFKSGDVFFRQEDTINDVYFIKSGILKNSVLSIEGKEHIKWFVSEGQLIGSTLGMIHNQKTGFNLIALEDGEAIKISNLNLKQMMANDHETAILIAEYAFKISMIKEKRELDFLIKTSEQRVEEFYRQYPSIVERLTQNELAKYLGITAVALSRIRTRLKIIEKRNLEPTKLSR